MYQGLILWKCEETIIFKFYIKKVALFWRKVFRKENNICRHLDLVKPPSLHQKISFTKSCIGLDRGQ